MIKDGIREFFNNNQAGDRHSSNPEPERPSPTPAPSRPDEKPDPVRKPSPGRPSPRPGETPRPVTEPKNILQFLNREYYHTLNEELKKKLKGADPFALNETIPNLFAETLLSEREENQSRSRTHLRRKHPRELPGLIRKAESGRQDRIIAVVKDYLGEIFGPLHRQIDEKLDIAWKNPYDTDEEPFSEEDVNREKYGREPEKNDEFDLDFVRETVLKSEIYYLLTQGFGILYMDGFFRMMRNKLTAIDDSLPSLYDEYHLSGHATHHRVFAEVMSGVKLPPGIDERMEKNTSEGRVWHTTEPVVDQETGNILGVNTASFARAEMGVVLAHEALKGAFQILTPWARLNENYLRDSEMAVVRSALNSYWAEIRQFTLGPSFFMLMQKTLHSLDINTQLSSTNFYLAIQNLILADHDFKRYFLGHLFSGMQFDSDKKPQVRQILLTPLNAPDTEGQIA